MIPLCSDLPETAEVCGKRYEIRWDHRTHIKISGLLGDKELSEGEKCALALNLFYPVQPPDTLEALKAMIAFYRGSDSLSACGGDKHGDGKPASPVFSFKYDADRICASFQSEYGIDLTREKLHWWRFRTLLLSLSPESAFGRAVASRIMPCPDGATAEQRAAWRAYKDCYRLPREYGEGENDPDFAMQMSQFF